MSTKMTKTMKITYTAVFAAIATVLMYFEFPLPFMPPFLKIDLSGAVILIGAFIFGVGPGIAMAAIKDLIHVTQTQTAGTGELQDFLLTCTLIVIAVTFYRLHTSRKGAFVGCAVGTVVMSIVAMITNKLIILPFYVKGMGWIQCETGISVRTCAMLRAWALSTAVRMTESSSEKPYQFIVSRNIAIPS